MSEYTNPQIEKIINEHIHSERDRALLLRRYVDGVKFDILAEEIGLSVQRTKEIAGDFRKKYL